VVYALRVALISAYTVFWGLLAMFVAAVSGEAVVWIGRRWLSWVFRSCGIRLVVEGLEHVARTRSYGFMSARQRRPGPDPAGLVAIRGKA
jgi:hypothetical protein